MKRCKLWQALVALAVFGAAGSPALLAQEVQLPEGVSGLPAPGGSQTAPLLEGFEGLLGEDAFAGVELPDAAEGGHSPFTFNMFVSLRDLHEDVAAAYISCTVLSSKPSSGDATRLYKGRVAVPFDAASRGYDGVVTVYAVPISADVDPRSAGFYACSLLLANGEGVEGGDDRRSPSLRAPICEADVVGPNCWYCPSPARPEDCPPPSYGGPTPDYHPLKTAVSVGEIDPIQGTATSCRYNVKTGDVVDCRPTAPDWK